MPLVPEKLLLSFTEPAVGSKEPLLVGLGAEEKGTVDGLRCMGYREVAQRKEEGAETPERELQRQSSAVLGSRQTGCRPLPGQWFSWGSLCWHHPHSLFCLPSVSIFLGPPLPVDFSSSLCASLPPCLCLCPSPLWSSSSPSEPRWGCFKVLLGVGNPF